MSLADKKMCIPVSGGRELADPNSIPKQTSLASVLDLNLIFPTRGELPRLLNALVGHGSLTLPHL